MEKRLIGIDLGGMSAKFGVYTQDGERLAKSTIPTNTEENGKYILDDIAKHIEELKETWNNEEGEIVAVGIGVPGPVKDQSVAKQAVNLGWGQVEVRKILEEKIGLPVRVENDANVAALGELWKGSGKEVNNLVLMTLGTGIGGGIVVDGKVIGGYNGCGGEIGHMPILTKDLDRVCGCGKRNCLEQVASATGMMIRAKELLEDPKVESSLRKYEDVSPKEIFEEAKQGDEVALQIVDECAGYLGRACAIIATVTNPECFVLGGGVSNAGKFYFDKIQKVFQELTFSGCKDAFFVQAELGNDAGMLGAAKLVADL